jgi:hypothetical protein
MNSLLDVDDIVGQQRCNAGKRMVVFKKSYPEYIFKGPFNEPVNGKVDAYAILKYRTDWLKYWVSFYILLPSSEYDFPSTFYGDKSPARTFVFPNIIQEFPTKSTKHIESFKTNGTNLSYNIQQSSKMMKFSNYLQDKSVPRTDKVKLITYELLRDYLLLYILGVGDMGLHNTMISGKEVYIIDYDETRKIEANRPDIFFSGDVDEREERYKNSKPLFFFKRDPSAMNGVRDMITNIFIPMYGRLAQELASLDVPENVTYLRDVSVFLLRKHNPSITQDIPFSSSGLRSDDANQEFIEENVPEGPFSTHDVLNHPSEPEEQQPEELEPTLDIKDFINKPFMGGVKGRGKLQFSGMNSSITPLGLSPSLVKSALQKSIRRGEFNQSVSAAFEMYAFKDVKVLEGRDAKCLVSNMYNRLAVISVEDLSPASLRIAAYINEWVIKWVKKGKDNLGTLASDGDRYDPYRLVGNIWLLSSAPKSRISSHLWTAYAKPEGRALAEKYGLEIESFDVSSLTEEDMNCKLADVYTFQETDYEIDNGRMVLTTCIIYNRLVNKNPNAVGWISYFIDKYGKEKVKNRGKRLATIILWEMFSVIGIADNIIHPLQEAYFNLSENRPALMAVVTNILYGDIDTFDILNPEEFDKYRDVFLDDPLINQLLDGNYTLDIKDYMLDKHSGMSGDPVKLRNKFTTIGAHVENEDMDFSNDLLKRIYIETPPPSCYAGPSKGGKKSVSFQEK